MWTRCTEVFATMIWYGGCSHEMKLASLKAAWGFLFEACSRYAMVRAGKLTELPAETSWRGPSDDDCDLAFGEYTGTCTGADIARRSLAGAIAHIDNCISKELLEILDTMGEELTGDDAWHSLVQAMLRYVFSGDKADVRLRLSIKKKKS